MFDKEKHHRCSIRFEGNDYSDEGAYFITICTYQRESIFGEIVDGDMVLNDTGAIVWEEWFNTGIVRNEIELDEFIVMPNHVHGIVIIKSEIVGCPKIKGNPQVAPTTETISVKNQQCCHKSNIDVSKSIYKANKRRNPVGAMRCNSRAIEKKSGHSTGLPLHPRRGSAPKSLASVICGFKTGATRRINKERKSVGSSLWQRNYYEHIICNEEELFQAREYIHLNPSNWDKDDENPVNINVGARRAVPVFALNFQGN